MKSLLLLFCLPLLGFSQGYTSYFTGNSTNVVTTPEFGVCLMGGATENDNAMIWLLQKANGGDVVVLRSSGSNGYNNYLYSELGVTVNSVETLVITSVAGATNPYVLDKVSKAEMIWFAGGDQWNYLSYFKDNALEDLLNYHINVKQAPIGGTSAGMAILGGRYFSAQNGTITSSQAMNNPFHPNLTLGGYDGNPGSTFLNVPFLTNVITDTHYDNPDRRGRHATFIARFRAGGTNVRGIACNEYVAVCFGADGKAKVYGDYPNYQEFAYFVMANCSVGNTIENIQSGQPLTWNFGGEALKVYKVPGTMQGLNYFDVSTWESATGSGGSWENWSVVNGSLNVVNGQPVNCTLESSEFDKQSIAIVPNPFNEVLYFNQEGIQLVEMYDSHGKLVVQETPEGNSIRTSDLAPGLYFVKLTANGTVTTQKLLKQ